MSVSIQPSAPSSLDHFKDHTMERNTPRFTAVNNASHLDQRKHSFTFRPDPTAALPRGLSSSGAGDPELPQEQGNAQSVPQSHSPDVQAFRATSQGFPEVCTLGKRKRTPDHDEPIRSHHHPAHRSPPSAARDPFPAVTSGQSPTTTARDWTELQPEQARLASPRNSQMGESLRYDLSKRESPQDLHAIAPSAASEEPERHSTSPQAENETGATTKKRAFAKRTKTGCHTCRRRKKKCDENKPQCQNCVKGSFVCEGYGERKIVGPPLQSNSRGRASTGSSVPAKAYIPQIPYHAFGPSMTDYRHLPGAEASRRVPDQSPNVTRESWPGRSTWASEGPRAAPYPQASPVEPIRSSSIFDTSREAATARENLVTAARLGTAIAPAGPAATQSSLDLNPSLSPPSAINPGNSDRFRERQRMLAGQPYLHYCDRQLVGDRRECRTALERYNNSTRPSVGTSEEECGRLFKSITMPELRPGFIPDGRPSGTIGRLVLVEAPFSCDYGYNIHLGDDVVIGSNCTMQDAASIRIGNRSIIGPNVRFYSMTLPTDKRARGGSRSLAIAAPITIAEDCFIGADVIILPGKTIGRGSVIGAGTVVSKNVPEDTVFTGHSQKAHRYPLPVQDEDLAHNPERYRDRDIPTLMLQARGWTFSSK